MMQKIWNHLIKRLKDDIGVRDYLHAVFSNLVSFLIIAILAISLASFVAR